MTPPVGEPWLRLDPRMLLVHPLRELVRFLPVLVGIVVAGTASGGGPWGLVGLGLPIGLGLVRYLTTSYRIAGGRVELRRGLVRRHTLSTPIDRVRTVDLTATVAHRVLGLATVVVGTGSVTSDDDERLELDGLPRAEAAALRIRLLQADAGRQSGAADPPAEPVVRFEARWLRYAPFTGTGLVATGAFAGAVAQASQGVDLRIDVSESDLAAMTGVIVLGGALVVVLLVGLLTVTGYLVVNGGFRLTREDHAWHIRRGLLTTRETSIDEDRVAGVSRGEHAALRLARGARLSAIVTGLGGSRRGGATLVPAAPRTTVETAAAAVLGTLAPMTADLRAHGAAAVRRRHSRALVGTLPLVVVLGVTVAAGAPPWLLLALLPIGFGAVALGRDRSRALGHGLVDGYVVTRSGSLQRHRDALAREHVIGWTLRDTWFQRRAGLVTVHATTAGGSGQVTALDVPAPDAVHLADAATPGLLTAFLA